MVPVVCNPELHTILTEIVARWSAATPAVLRLFRNDYEPTPGSVAGDFVEANFDGYNPVLLTGELSAPALAAAGWYESISDLYTFGPPAVGPGNVIFGAYLTLLGVAIAATRFDAAITMEPGFPPFRLRLRVSAKSESLFSLE